MKAIEMEQVGNSMMEHEDAPNTPFLPPANDLSFHSPSESSIEEFDSFISTLSYDTRALLDEEASSTEEEFQSFVSEELSGLTQSIIFPEN